MTSRNVLFAALLFVFALPHRFIEALVEVNCSGVDTILDVAESYTSTCSLASLTIIQPCSGVTLLSALTCDVASLKVKLRASNATCNGSIHISLKGNGTSCLRSSTLPLVVVEGESTSDLNLSTVVIDLVNTTIAFPLPWCAIGALVSVNMSLSMSIAVRVTISTSNVTVGGCPLVSIATANATAWAVTPASVTLSLDATAAIFAAQSSQLIHYVRDEIVARMHTCRNPELMLKLLMSSCVVQFTVQLVSVTDAICAPITVVKVFSSQLTGVGAMSGALADLSIGNTSTSSQNVVMVEFDRVNVAFVHSPHADSWAAIVRVESRGGGPRIWNALVLLFSSCVVTLSSSTSHLVTISSNDNALMLGGTNVGLWNTTVRIPQSNISKLIAVSAGGAVSFLAGITLTVAMRSIVNVSSVSVNFAVFGTSAGPQLSVDGIDVLIAEDSVVTLSNVENEVGLAMFIADILHVSNLSFALVNVKAAVYGGRAFGLFLCGPAMLTVINTILVAKNATFHSDAVETSKFFVAASDNGGIWLGNSSLHISNSEIFFSAKFGFVYTAEAKLNTTVSQYRSDIFDSSIIGTVASLWVHGIYFASTSQQLNLLRVTVWYDNSTLSYANVYQGSLLCMHGDRVVNATDLVLSATKCTASLEIGAKVLQVSVNASMGNVTLIRCSVELKSSVVRLLNRSASSDSAVWNIVANKILLENFVCVMSNVSTLLASSDRSTLLRLQAFASFSCINCSIELTDAIVESYALVNNIVSIRGSENSTVNGLFVRMANTSFLMPRRMPADTFSLILLETDAPMRHLSCVNLVVNFHAMTISATSGEMLALASHAQGFLDVESMSVVIEDLHGFLATQPQWYLVGAGIGTVRIRFAIISLVNCSTRSFGDSAVFLLSGSFVTLTDSAIDLKTSVLSSIGACWVLRVSSISAAVLTSVSSLNVTIDGSRLVGNASSFALSVDCVQATSWILTTNIVVIFSTLQGIACLRGQLLFLTDVLIDVKGGSAIENKVICARGVNTLRVLRLVLSGHNVTFRPIIGMLVAIDLTGSYVAVTNSNITLESSSIYTTTDIFYFVMLFADSLADVMYFTAQFTGLTFNASVAESATLVCFAGSQVVIANTSVDIVNSAIQTVCGKGSAFFLVSGSTTITVDSFSIFITHSSLAGTSTNAIFLLDVEGGTQTTRNLLVKIFDSSLTYYTSQQCWVVQRTSQANTIGGSNDYFLAQNSTLDITSTSTILWHLSTGSNVSLVAFRVNISGCSLALISTNGGGCYCYIFGVLVSFGGVAITVDRSSQLGSSLVVLFAASTFLFHDDINVSHIDFQLAVTGYIRLLYLSVQQQYRGSRVLFHVRDCLFNAAASSIVVHAQVNTVLRGGSLSQLIIDLSGVTSHLFATVAYLMCTSVGDVSLIASNSTLRDLSSILLFAYGQEQNSSVLVALSNSTMMFARNTSDYWNPTGACHVVLMLSPNRSNITLAFTSSTIKLVDSLTALSFPLDNTLTGNHSVMLTSTAGIIQLSGKNVTSWLVNVSVTASPAVVHIAVCLTRVEFVIPFNNDRQNGFLRFSPSSEWRGNESSFLLKMSGSCSSYREYCSMSSVNRCGDFVSHELRVLSRLQLVYSLVPVMIRISRGDQTYDTTECSTSSASQPVTAHRPSHTFSGPSTSIDRSLSVSTTQHTWKLTDITVPSLSPLVSPSLFVSQTASVFPASFSDTVTTRQSSSLTIPQHVRGSASLSRLLVPVTFLVTVTNTMPKANVASAGIAQIVAQSIALKQVCSGAGSIDSQALMMSDYVDNLFQLHFDDSLPMSMSFVGGCTVSCVLLFACLYVLRLMVSCALQCASQALSPHEGILLVREQILEHHGLPGSLLPAVVPVMQPALCAAVILLTFQVRSVASVLLAVATILWIGLLLGRLLIAVFITPLIYHRPLPVVCVETSESEARRSLGVLRRGAAGLLRPLWRWEPRASCKVDGVRFLERYGEVVAPYKENRCWFLAVELSSIAFSSAINGVFMGLPPSTVCHLLVVSVSLQILVCAVMIVAVVTLRPHVCGADTLSLIVGSLLTIVCLVLSLLPNVDDSVVVAIVLVSQVFSFALLLPSQLVAAKRWLRTHRNSLRGSAVQLLREGTMSVSHVMSTSDPLVAPPRLPLQTSGDLLQGHQQIVLGRLMGRGLGEQYNSCETRKALRILVEMCCAAVQYRSLSPPAGGKRDTK